MKRIILFSAFLLLCFAGCKTTESIDPSYELSSNIEDHKQPSQAADSESSIEFSSEELAYSLSQPEKASSEPNNQNSTSSVQTQDTVQNEMQFLFVDKNGSPVQGIAGSVLLMPDRKGSNLYAKTNGMSYSGADGILYYSTSGYKNKQQNHCFSYIQLLTVRYVRNIR